MSLASLPAASSGLSRSQWPFWLWPRPGSIQALPASSSPATAPTKKPSIHEPLGGRKVFSCGFETAACPPRNLQMLRSASRLPWLLQKPLTSNHHLWCGASRPLKPWAWHPSLQRQVAFPGLSGLSGCDRVLAASSGSSSLQPCNSSNKKTFHPRAAGWPQSLFLRFRDRRLPPRNLQMLRSASRLPWLLQKPLTSNHHLWCGASRPLKPWAWHPSLQLFQPPPALQQLQQKNLPSTSRWVAAKSFLTVSRPPPGPLETFKCFAAPRACPGFCKSL